MKKIEWALQLAAGGLPVFPLEPNGKRPLTKNGFKDATTSVYQIKKWWDENPEANIGIIMGQASGRASLDVDIKNGAKGRESLASIKGITPTFTVRTPSGGFHLYYKSPGPLRSRIGLLPGLDLKADGGYIVGPGSEINGTIYKIIDPEAAVEELPESILALMRNRNGIKHAQGDGKVILEGFRNGALASLAGTMRCKGMSGDEIVAALMAVNAKRCSPPLLDKEVEAIANSIAKYPAGDGSEPFEDEELRPPEFTDDALALKFTSRHAMDWRYVAAWSCWLHWDGSCWRKERTLRIYDLARMICREAFAQHHKPKIPTKIASAITIAAVEKLARADRKHAAMSDQWDEDFLLFILSMKEITGEILRIVQSIQNHRGLMNRMLVLAGGDGKSEIDGVKMRPHRREDYCTKISPACPGPDKECPTWLSFLADITAGDVDLQRYLARVAGYCITGLTIEHVMFFLYGTGANGKSVFLNTLAAIWGDYATNAPFGMFMETRGDRHPTDLAKLRGARLVIATEVGQGRHWDEAKIKALTGGDTISARFMRQDFFDYKPQFKLMIASNHKPSLRNVDEAMRRRLHLIPFTVTISPEKQDKTLPERLWAEKDGIMTWAIRGYAEWNQIGLKPPPCVLAATEEYFESQDAIKRWLDEECILSDRATVTTEEAYGAWKMWAEKQGEYVGSMKKFTEELTKRGFERWRSGQKRGIRGLVLRGMETQEEMF